MCLANSEVGDYQPVEVQGQPLQPSTMLASQTMKTSQRSKVSLLGVDTLWDDCPFIPADWGS